MLEKSYILSPLFNDYARIKSKETKKLFDLVISNCLKVNITYSK